MFVLSVTNHYNLIQIKLQAVQNFKIQQILALLSEASLIFRYGDNQTERFDKLQFQSTPTIIMIETTGLSFTTVSCDYRKPFEFELQMHIRQEPPTVPDSLASRMLEATSDPVELVWPITDVRKLPLVKRSPLYTFSVGGNQCQILFTMETNKDRLKLRICPFHTYTKQLTQSIDTVSVTIQPSNHSQPIWKESLKVEKAINGLVFLTDIMTSFANITENNRIPLELTIQLRFHNTLDYSFVLPPEIHRKPVEFKWKMMNVQQFPMLRTSPWFKMRMHDKSLLPVAFWLKQIPNQPVQVGLTASADIAKLFVSVDRATAEFIYPNGQIKKVTRALPYLQDDLVCFDLEDNHFFFSELTNGYKDSFQIAFRVHLAVSNEGTTHTDHQPISRLINRLESLPSQLSIITPQPINERVDHLESLPTRSAITTNTSCLFAANPQPTELQQQLNTLLVDQTDCDVYFDCHGTCIGAHRPILQARSVFFKDLFRQHSGQTLHTIHNVDAQTMADALQFMYTGTAPRIASTAERMLSVAKQMALPELHDLAQQHLAEGNAAVNSNTSVTKLLDLFGVEDMQKQVGTFIEENMDDLLANANFEQELRKRPDVCFELIGLIASSGHLKA